MSDGRPVRVIKKKVKQHAHHGGAWKVAYADFVTAMMALFIVLWLLTQTDQKTRAELAEYFRTGTLPGGTMAWGEAGGSHPPVPVDVFPEGLSGGNAKEASSDQLAGAVRDMLKQARVGSDLGSMASHVNVRVSEQGVLIELVDGSDNLVFSLGSSELKPGVVSFLEQLAPLLTQTGNLFDVQGHTDARRFEPGARKTNWQLSFERADQARRVLEQSGVPREMIRAVQAFADSQPYRADDPFAPENRRLSIVVSRRPYDAETAPADQRLDGGSR